MELPETRSKSDLDQTMTEPNDTITLLPSEQLLRELLINCRNNICDSSGLEIWISGGWVRDRLLGLPCSDIDISLSTMTGEQFGIILTEFFSTNKEKYWQRSLEPGAPNFTFTGFHTTKKNPGKSKKLATAVGVVFGLDLDLVNLRKEVYDDDSRTPEIEFGTAKEDVFRRDATVNALLYNMDTLQNVDLTGKGLSDMTARIMRTPLEPRQTFLDDPLRVLRLVRIGSRLGYTIDDQAMASMKAREIHVALDTKVSRERIGIEVCKMMKSTAPQHAFRLLFEANLYATVFIGRESSTYEMLQTKLPVQETGTPWPASWPRAYSLLAHIATDANIRNLFLRPNETQDQLWTMAAYAPIAACRGSVLRVTMGDITEALKAPGYITKLIESSLKHMDSIRETLNLVTTQIGDAPPPSAIGMALRSWGSTWRLQMLYSLLSEVVYLNSLPAPAMPFQHSQVDSYFNPQLQQYSKLIDFITSNDLQEAHLLKPVLDGNEIKGLFGVKKGGSFLATATNELLAWQFDNRGCGKDDAKKWLSKQREKLRIP